MKMTKKKWLVIPVVMGVMVLAMTVLGGVALAQTDDSDSSSTWSSFTSRVASILGLDETTVKDAMDQAAKEMQDESLKTKLDSMVAEGRITQEQADEYYEWYQSRPESLSPASPLNRLEGSGIFGEGGKGGRGHHGGRGLNMQDDDETSPSVTPAPESSEEISL